MKLTIQETYLLAIGEFFDHLHKDFPDITFAKIEIRPSSLRYFKPKENSYPLEVHVEYKNRTSRYHWNFSSDDEYPISNRWGEYFGFHEMKKYIEEKLPQAFGKKSFYKYEHSISTKDIDMLVKNLKSKKLMMELDNTLGVSEVKRSRLKL